MPKNEILTDTQLMDYLSKRQYVECTDQGYEDPKRFEWWPGLSLRQALSNHILKHKRKQK